MSSASPHEQAVELLSHLRAIASERPIKALRSVIAWMVGRELHGHVVPVLVMGNGKEVLSLEAATPYGEALLHEVIVCHEFSSCPSGMCQPDLLCLCKWCGTYVPLRAKG